MTPKEKTLMRELAEFGAALRLQELQREAEELFEMFPEIRPLSGPLSRKTEPEPQLTIKDGEQK